LILHRLGSYARQHCRAAGREPSGGVRIGGVVKDHPKATLTEIEAAVVEARGIHSNPPAVMYGIRPTA